MEREQIKNVILDQQASWETKVTAGGIVPAWKWFLRNEEE